MSTVHVDLGTNSYDIEIGQGLLRNAADHLTSACNDHTRVALVCDSNVEKIYAAAVEKSLQDKGVDFVRIVFAAGEESKSMSGLGFLCNQMLAGKLDRKSCVLALGGGVTGDMTGFAAACFMRGIRFLQLPTTLLAMVDSSSGGKTGVNLPHGKNIVGAFHQPSRVIIDIDTLRTLPEEEMHCGLAEVIKHGVILDETYFGYVEENAEAIKQRNPEVLTEVVAGSCRIKGGVVSQDEKEHGIRALLNLGHTFGHAFEALSNYKMRHGDAVAVGTLAACDLAERLWSISPEIRSRIESLFKTFGITCSVSGYEPEPLLQAMYGDKKTMGGKLRFVLPQKIGAAKVEAVTDTDAVLCALQSVLS